LERINRIDIFAIHFITMKILAIRGKNLASLEGEFEIDFTAEPLKSAGIFAITGSTGSGKSTLLDALCLALFDDTPRTNRASENNIQIVDVKNRTINQKDSRNILRRGTGDGFAEVDFVSLGGEKFRSRWSVRRSRDRIDGTLQNSELRLANITLNIEEQGRKTELLAKIVDLTGLTFEQFTRAVLLAQGEFATFMKATQKEKAELLEKLTGTEIYSRISVAVYEKSKNAEQELNIIRERIKDIELLSDEETNTLVAKKQTTVQEIDILKKEIDILTNKVKWLADEKMLSEGVKLAQQHLTDAASAIDDAALRYSYLAQVDSVQEIRDCFNELRTSNRQLADSKKHLVEQENMRDANALLLKQAAGKVTLCEDCLRKHNEKFELVEPKIKLARELDIQLAGAKANAENAEKEYKQAKDHKDKLEKQIAETEKLFHLSKGKSVHVELWFSQHKQYRDIVSRTDWIVTLLDDAAAATKQKHSNAQTLASTQALLDSETAKIAELAKESERLNKLLPAEIAALRAKLEEGKPCPVCGSLHHLHQNTGGDSLHEAELNNAKKDIADKTAAQIAKIEKLEKENIRLASVIENYNYQIKDAMSKLDNILAAFSDWKTTFEQGTLQGHLKSVAETWNKHVIILNNTNEQAANLQTNLQLAVDQLTETIATYTAKAEKYNETKTVAEELHAQRVALFDGKYADEVEQMYVKRRDELSDALNQLKNEQNKTAGVNEKQAGAINQISQEILRLTTHCNLLQKAVNEWLALKNGAITAEQLSDLLSKNNEWIITEREQLNRLHQNRTAALATLDERTKTLENHRLHENKPSHNETADALRETLTAKQELVQQKTAANTEIDILLGNHNKGKERIAAFEKDLNEKTVLAENWKKLNDLFGSADGAKFKVLAQGYTLDALLAYANKHLQELSKRYEIQRIADTLALQVTDLDMMGETRTVHSLSGGESFLVSLALALGLSSLSSNRMKVESLFIDEGFGSLDIDTLRTAMDALERLQTQGRKIGVISHVPEMTERISAQIRIIKTTNGRSRVEVRGINAVES
jgi:exonuclease SbcC